MNYKKHLSEPWFTLIMLGIKTIEGRLNKGSFKEINIGDTITFFNNDAVYREVTAKVISIRKYCDFESYLRKETLKKCLPGYTRVSDGINLYYKYFSRDDEKKYNVKAYTLELLK